MNIGIVNVLSALIRAGPFGLRHPGRRRATTTMDLRYSSAPARQVGAAGPLTGVGRWFILLLITVHSKHVPVKHSRTQARLGWTFESEASVGVDMKTSRRAGGPLVGIAFRADRGPLRRCVAIGPRGERGTKHCDGQASWPGGILTAPAGMYMFQSI